MAKNPLTGKIDSKELGLGEMMSLIRALNDVSPGVLEGVFDEIMADPAPITSDDKDAINFIMDEAYKRNRIEEEEKAKPTNNPLFGSW